MKKLLKKVIKFIYSSTLFDLFLTPFVFIAALLFWMVRRIGFRHLKITKRVLLKVGVIPIRNHYYEPLFDAKNLSKPLSDERYLPGIVWNTEEQLQILDSFNYVDEFTPIPNGYQDDLIFNFNN